MAEGTFADTFPKKKPASPGEKPHQTNKNEMRYDSALP